MGSMIQLEVGDLEVDWGKNSGFVDYSQLFQTSDIAMIPYHYVDDHDTPIIEHKEGYSRRLADVLPRLDLLGLTHKASREVYRSSLEEREYYDSLLQDDEGSLEGDYPSFRSFCKAMFTVDITDVPTDYSERLPCKFFSSRISSRLGFSKERGLDRISSLIESLPPWCLLRILALNPRNLDMPVKWAFADVVDGGSVRRDQVVKNPSSREQFLLVTEGSSDSKILRKALDMLRPEVADFFRFVDMEEGYPFTGTGNLYRFCQGLVSIGILNRVVVIYDNDAEGDAKLIQTCKLSLPSNIRAMKLPNLTQFKQFRTVGPNGKAREDINGAAAAIECYLDLDWHAGARPQVRWTSYNTACDRYQGLLDNKDSYTQRFLDLRRREPGYDFRKMERLLDTIIRECVAMAEEEVRASVRENWD